MTKKPILKDFPEKPTGEIFKSDEETVKIITDLADFYGIEYELKIDKNMTKKTRKLNDLVKRESGGDRTERIAELFKQQMQKVPAFKTVTKFLWFQKTIEGKTKWLVTASWQEQFVEVIDQESLDMGSINCLVWTWKPVKWL